ncbi:MAG: element excision factor XisI family protein [Aggregatilineales bacterium]
MATLPEVVRTVVKDYAVKGANFESFLTISPDGQVFTVVDVAKNDQGHRFTATSLFVHLLNGRVVVEHDDNDKPLVDALIQSGVSSENIILAYAGEPVPEAT